MFLTSFSLLGAKVQGNESSRGGEGGTSKERKFHIWDFHSRERKYVGTKVPVTSAFYMWRIPTVHYIVKVIFRPPGRISEQILH